MFKRKPQKREKSEFNEKVIDLRRVTRVVAGGKRFRFRATLVLGDNKGRVGIGVAKGADVQDSIAKAKSKAKKNMITIQLKDSRTINHEVEAKYSAALVMLRPAPDGHGLKAGGAVRAVLTMVGVKDITGKCIGRTKNKLTNAQATIAALKKISPSRSKVPVIDKPKSELVATAK